MTETRLEPHRVLARDRNWIWHVAHATFPDQAETACGRRVLANLFATEGNPDIFGGPERHLTCQACFAAPAAAPASQPEAKGGDSPAPGREVQQDRPSGVAVTTAAGEQSAPAADAWLAGWESCRAQFQKATEAHADMVGYKGRGTPGGSAAMVAVMWLASMMTQATPVPPRMRAEREGAQPSVPVAEIQAVLAEWQRASISNSQSSDERRVYRRCIDRMEQLLEHH